ncbi:MAG: DUF2284 domain-containing protein [Spirochaetales bacterium]|nr:DUF2284 domain-containing protein [Spirochaetales bacterium]
MITVDEKLEKTLGEDVNIRPIKNKEIVVDRELRKACEQNYCGHYGKNCMCPPLVGDIDECIDKVQAAGDGLLIQSVFQLEDSLDFEGMMKAAEDHTANFLKLKSIVEESLDETSVILPLNAGQCTTCPECAALEEGGRCRTPEKAIASVESHGIDVMKTLGRVGLQYNNGTNTVSYVGVILEKDG